MCATQTQSLDSSQVNVCFRERAGQLGDRRWQICLTTNVHLSAYWRALSHWWFMLKILHIHYHFHHLPTFSLQHLPICAAQHSARRETKSSPVIAPFHAAWFAKKTVDLSLGRIGEHHLFSFTLPSLSRRKIILYIYEWSCLCTQTCFHITQK